jgi:putative FmdB family regulatory protein
MPIYAYRCATCGHAKDVLQKMSDPLLTVCPACGAQTFVKQLTAAGFQLKGSGWYVTDFKGDSSAKPASGDAKDGDAKPDAAKPDAAAPAAPTAPAGSAGKTEAAPAPAPAPAAAPPASGAK